MAKTAEATVEETVELTDKQIINAGIDRFIEATGVDSQKARYKAQRAIAFQAFVEAIDDGDFDALVDRAIKNVNELPSGWEIEKPEPAAKPAPVKKAPATKTPATKAPAKAPAKKPAAKAAASAPVRKRPTR